MRAALVVNRRARRLRWMADPTATIAEAARSAGFDIVAVPRPDAALGHQIAAAGAAAPDLVLAAGGDGTVSALAASLAGTGIPIGVIPGGTMNRVAARLRLPPEPLAAIDALSRAVPVRCDLASVNGQMFLYQSLIGHPARLMRFRERARRTGWLLLARATLRSLHRPWRRRLALQTPAGAWRRHAVAGVVTVPAPDDPAHLLRVEAVRRTDALSGLLQGWHWIRGRLRAAPDVAHVSASRLLVLSPALALRVSLDGEARLLRPPLRYVLHRDGVLLLAPRSDPAP